MKALVRRLPEEHELRSKIIEDIRITRAGINGEKALTQIFEKYTFPEPYYVFHDVNLKSTGPFQIDTLFLSQKGATILEVKNIAGTIHFPTGQNQMMRTLESGHSTLFECPSVQLNRNKILLDDWFMENEIQIPIIQTAVVFPYTNQQIDNSRDQLKILFPLEVPVYLRRALDNPTLLNVSTLDAAAHKILKTCHAYNPFPICEKYSIPYEQIKKGVICQRCGLQKMTPISAGWYCERCNYYSKTAYETAVIEYFMLFGKELTNSLLRDFIGIENSDRARRLLQRMNLPHRGKNKGRVYFLSLEQLKRSVELLEKY